MPARYYTRSNHPAWRDETKHCPAPCGEPFGPSERSTKTQWKAAKYCSLQCAARATQAKLRQAKTKYPTP
jgi:hypothetical protein